MHALVSVRHTGASKCLSRVFVFVVESVRSWARRACVLVRASVHTNNVAYCASMRARVCVRALWPVSERNVNADSRVFGKQVSTYHTDLSSNSPQDRCFPVNFIHSDQTFQRYLSVEERDEQKVLSCWCRCEQGNSSSTNILMPDDVFQSQTVNHNKQICCQRPPRQNCIALLADLWSLSQDLTP